MTIDRRSMLGMTAGAAILSASHARAQDFGAPVSGDPTEIIELWPGGAPGTPAAGTTEKIEDRGSTAQRADRGMTGVIRPRLAVFRPAKSNGAAMLVMPGGGYWILVYDKEGYEIGRWLASQGYTAFVLLYRLPRDGWTAGGDVALSDAQRAMRLIRHRAGAYGFDAARVGAMGFSAGGHLCADLLTRNARETYQPVDAADALSARPFLGAPIYPVVSLSPQVTHAGSRLHLIGKDPSAELEAAHSADRNVTDATPPTFLMHAEDDTVVPVANSLLLAAALRAKGVKVETHLFNEGGHGFGLRETVKPVAIWPELFLRWATSMGLPRG
jgi:acetyl esterase/lipase